MNKKAILNTAVCYFSNDDDCFVVESPLLEVAAGIGETRQAAYSNFESHVDTAYESYLEGRLKHIYDKPGRPSKGRIAFNADVKVKTKKQLKSLAKELVCTQGELLDFLLFFYQAQSGGTVVDAQDMTLYEALKDMGDDIQRIVQKRLEKSKSKAIRKKAV